MINDDLIVQKIPRENSSTVCDGPPPFSREAFFLSGSLEKGAGSRRLTEGLLRKSFTPSRRFHRRTPPPASLVPLVLSGPLCPAGISPPRGESPLKGRLFCIGALLWCIGSPLGELAPQVTEGCSRKSFTPRKRFHKEPLHRLTTVPLPFQGRLFYQAPL